MADQPLEKLQPADIIAKSLNADGKQELAPGSPTDKNSRLSDLLGAGGWSSLDVRLVVWREDINEWWMWVAQ